MPTTESTISTGYSNFISPALTRYSWLMASAAAAPKRIITLAKRANPSETNDPSKAVRAPSGWNPTQSPTSTRSTHAPQSTLDPTSRPA